MERLIEIWPKTILVMCYIPGVHHLGISNLVPARFMFPPLHKTDRRSYEAERRFYRFTSYMAKQGFPLDRRGYYYRKTIALKYDWPFIKESFDND